jgi:hypothetical protein
MTIDFESWDAGYVDGQVGRPSHCPDNLDSFSYSIGYREGRAYRMRNRLGHTVAPLSSYRNRAH